MTVDADSWIGVVDASQPAPLLYPATAAMPKGLLPVFDKPLVYYPLSVLMLAGIREIALLSATRDIDAFQRLLGDGSQFGIRVRFLQSDEPTNLIGRLNAIRGVVGNRSVAWISGDCLIYADRLQKVLLEAMSYDHGASILVHPLKRARQRNVVTVCRDRTICPIVGAESASRSRATVMDVSFFWPSAFRAIDRLSVARNVAIHDLEVYFALQEEGVLHVHACGRGFAWLDTSTLEHINGAANFIAALEANHGLKIGCPEEVALQKGYITGADILSACDRMSNGYANYLMNLVQRSFP